MEHTACQRKLIAIARSFRTAMVTTRQPDGAMHTRPMSIAQVDDNGDLWFATGASSVKLLEIDNDSTTGVVMQRGLRFAAFTGTAESRFDRELARKLWSETWRPWFPGGPTDSELKLMCVHVKNGEFWDLTGVRGMRYALEAVRCSLAGTRMSDAPDDDRHGIASFAPA
jgi:general stress protein 26